MFLPSSDRTVVLVDDSRDHCLLTERALRQTQPATRCVTLENGDAAIQHLHGCIRQGGRPELMLLDWRMPGRSGEDVLTWARSQASLNALPILVLSGGAFPEDRHRATELGANGYLIKPSNLQGYDILARQVDGWREQLAAGPTPASVVAKVSPGHWGRRSAQALREIVRGWGPRSLDTAGGPPKRRLRRNAVRPTFGGLAATLPRAGHPATRDPPENVAPLARGAATPDDHSWIGAAWLGRARTRGNLPAGACSHPVAGAAQVRGKVGTGKLELGGAGNRERC